MDRREFVRTTCSVCLGGPILTGMLSGCESAYYVTGSLEPAGLSVLPSDFVASREGMPATYLPYLIVRNDKLEFPICLYRFSESEYSALLMKCTHQGTELQVFGDHLHCPAHGSEFSSKGKVAQGPAEIDLRSFRVIASPEKILVELK